MEYAIAFLVCIGMLTLTRHVINRQTIARLRASDRVLLNAIPKTAPGVLLLVAPSVHVHPDLTS